MSCSVLSAKVNFEDDVLPLLQDYCMDCHGPEKKKSGFRLDRRVYLLKGGDSGFPAVVSGDLKKSFLLELIKSKDPEERMPPKGDAMFDDEIALLEQWIEDKYISSFIFSGAILNFFDVSSFNLGRRCIPCTCRSWLGDEWQLPGLEAEQPDARTVDRRQLHLQLHF